MTVDELRAREAIRHTLASYNVAGDRLRIDDFLAVFTDDAVFESGRPEQPGLRLAGKAAIRAWFGGWGGGSGDAHTRSDRPAPRVLRHHLTTCLIEPTGPGTARVRTYFAAYTQIGPDHCGHYLDDFRETGDRWLIAYRRVRTDWSAPDSLLVPPEDRG